MATPTSTLTSSPVTTALFIGGKERQTADKMAIADPGQARRRRRSCRFGHAAGCPRCRRRREGGLPGLGRPHAAAARGEDAGRARGHRRRNRDEDAAILSQENGKIRFEAWVDSLVFEIRWKLALATPTRSNAAKVLPPVPGPSRSQTTVSLPAARRRHRHRAVQLADRDPRRLAAARAAGRQHRDREAAAHGAAGDHPRRAAHRREAAAGRAQRRHRPGREHGRR